MHLVWTEAAKERILEKMKGRQDYLLLKYNSEGCGCAVNGVTELRLVEEVDDDMEEIETNGPRIYVEKSKKIFLEEEMKIDTVEKSNSFILKSPNQVINPRLHFYGRA